MIKRFISLFICFVMLIGMALPVYANEAEVAEGEAIVTTLKISSKEDLLEFAEKCRMDTYSLNLYVILEKDIDLTECDFSGIPIFSGTFDGNGHKITGLSITTDSSMQGLFRCLTATAVVQSLLINGSLQPGDSQNEIGAIAGRNEGHILNCSFSGTVSGGDYVGGIAGTNAVSGVIENCFVNGDIHGNHFVGGAAGENNGIIRNCYNKALINTTPQQNNVEISDITIDSLTNTEAVNTVTDIGGIAGFSRGVIRDCSNRADVGYQHMGYNIGGIAGTQSGYIVNCDNLGDIQGRKEVGGIVGQMEPTLTIEYTMDTIQILQGQLGAMSGLVNQASSNAQTNANGITGHIGILQDQTHTAIDAAEILIPKPGNSETPDADTIIAAQNSLAASLNAMPSTINSISSATETTVYSLASDLNAITGQINAMSQTLNNASANLGGTITDISDQDTPDQLTGKTENCVNYGDVLADLNAGGIAGAMATENDMDILEDWEINGKESFNFRSEVRAVILNCENHGKITGSKQNVGGIAGWQFLGLIKNCSNTGTVDAANADYVGGVSGRSSGFIRSDYAKCEIYGKKNTGGIAGNATIVSDCLSQVKLFGGKSNLGAILGFAEKHRSDEENPIARNYYLCVDTDFGAIDGISYSGQAEPMELDAFMEIENLPELFRSVTVRFVFDDGKTTEISVAAGGNLSKSNIPSVPEKEGFTGEWNGLDSAKLSNIMFDMTFEAVYTSYTTSIQSEQCRENGLPLLLAEGAFTDDAAIIITPSELSAAVNDGQQILESWDISASEDGTVARFLLPDNVDSEHIKLQKLNEDGSWSDVPFTQDGSYLVFALDTRYMTIALAEASSNGIVLYTAAAALSLFALISVLIFAAKKKHLVKEEINDETI